MRKAVIGFVVLFCLVGVASALPTLANGGTIYLNYACQNNGGTVGAAQILKYVDIGSNWLPTGAVGSKVVTLATITGSTNEAFGGANTGGGANGGGANISSWTGPTQVAPHSAQILMMSGGQLISVNSSGATTVLNAAPSTPNTWTITVNSNFTPVNQARGAYDGYGATHKIFTETVAGNNILTVASNAGGMNEAQGYYGTAPAYSAIKPGTLGTYYVIDSNNGNAHTPVDGVTWAMENPNGGTRQAFAVYHKSDNSGYISVKMADSNGNTFYTGNPKSNSAVAVGDTNGDGIPDFYYIGGNNTTAGIIYHAEDAYNNGDISDAGESWDSGLRAPLASTEGKRTIQLVQGTDGAWAMVIFRTGQGSTGGYNVNPTLTIAGLGPDGNWDLSSVTTLLDNTESSFATPNTVGGYVSYGQPGLTFVQTQQSPEPATLMLVGTGVLGLAGIIRRRLIS